MTPDLVNRLRAWLRLGRTRRQIVMGTLALGLLGGIANWAKPKVEALLFPPPTPLPALCSRVAITIGKVLLASDINAAKAWINEPNTPMLLTGLVWDEKDKRVELWMSDGKETVWQIEFVCYKASQGHPMVFGEVEKYPLKEIVEYEKYQDSIESQTK